MPTWGLIVALGFGWLGRSWLNELSHHIIAFTSDLRGTQNKCISDFSKRFATVQMWVRT